MNYTAGGKYVIQRDVSFTWDRDGELEETEERHGLGGSSCDYSS